MQLCLSSHVLYFLLNYVQHINDIRDTPFPFFGRQRIKKKNIMNQFHGQPTQYRGTKSKKLRFGSLQLCLKSHVQYFFFKNYAQNFNDIRDQPFPFFGRQRIQKKNIVHHFHGQPPQNWSTE